VKSVLRLSLAAGGISRGKVSQKVCLTSQGRIALTGYRTRVTASKAALFMRKATLSLLAAMSALASTAGALSAQTVLFQENFQGATLGEGPHTPNWAPWDTNFAAGTFADRSASVQSGSAFGPGPNQFLSVQNGTNLTFGKRLTEFDANIVTLSFDYIARANSTGYTNRWVNVTFYGDSGTIDNANRIQTVGLQSSNQQVRPTRGSFGAMNEVVQFHIIMNNSNAAISLFSGGSEYVVPAGQASVWANGSHLATYTETRTLANSVGMSVGGFAFVQDNNAARNSYDLDNIVVYGGAVIPEPSTYALIFGGLVLAGAFLVRRRRR
jgi:hypothetical protein